MLTHRVNLQVGADIRESQKQAGFIEERAKRKNHDPTGVSQLLAVPCYADLLEDDADASGDEVELPSTKSQSGLVKSRAGWRKEMTKWVQEEQARSDDSDDNDLGEITHRRRSKWLPRSLELLFGGRKETNVDEQRRRANRRQVYTEEARLMELLVDEEQDEERIPDDGELEGSGDDFDG
jgi:hypothetical protein